MTGQDLYTQLHEARVMAHKAIEQFVPTTKARAEAECAYWTQLDMRETEARADGVPATIARDRARADKRVQEAYVRFRCAEALEEATRQQHMMHKKDADILNGMAAREWSVQ